MPSELIIRSETIGRLPAQPQEKPAGVVMTPAGIDEFIDGCRASGCSAGTLERYRASMNRIYNLLPQDKIIRSGTIEKVRDLLVEKGYSPSTVNVTLSVSSVWLDFIGHRELQFTERVEINRTPLELTRQEYLRLLQTAKSQGAEKKYLLIKLFALTGLTANTLDSVTVEAVRENKFQMPDFFATELLAYANRKGIKKGSIFLTKDGVPLVRTSVLAVIQYGNEESGVPQNKVTPKCLSRLKDSAKTEVKASLTRLVEQYMDRQVELEEALYGWNR